MSDENKVEQENPSLETVNIEDLFGKLDDEVALTSQREQSEEPEEKVADEKPAEEAGEQESTKSEESEEKAEEDTEETPDAAKEFEAKLEAMEKRFKDTQAAFHKANQANQKVLEKISNGEELTEDDLKALVTEEPESPNAIQAMVSEVNEALPIAKAVVSQVSGRDMESIEADVEAFNQLATVDPVLVKQLVETPVNDRAAFVIKRGGELKEVFDIVQENGGSVSEAIANSGKISTRKINKMREEIELEVKKKFEDKYKDYVSSSASKPSARGTSPKKPDSTTVDHGAISASDLF